MLASWKAPCLVPKVCVYKKKYQTVLMTIAAHPAGVTITGVFALRTMHYKL